MATVIVTRPEPALVNAAAVYQAAGLDVFKAPCFAITTNDAVQAQWLTAKSEVWIILSVHALHHALLLAPDLKPEVNTRVIAVGPAVAKAWQHAFNHPIESHPLMNSEGVLKLLTAQPPTSIKILTANQGRDAIKSYAMDHQISYTQINTYQRTPLDLDATGLLAVYENSAPKVVILTATSCGILRQFESQLTAEIKPMVLAQPLVVGATRIADLARELGFNDVHVAANPGDSAMCEAVINCAG